MATLWNVCLWTKIIGIMWENLWELSLTIQFIIHPRFTKAPNHWLNQCYAIHRRINTSHMFCLEEAYLVGWRRTSETLTSSVINSCILYHPVCALQRRHNGRDGVPNHKPHDCLLNRLFRRRSKKTSKPRVAGLCAGNSPVTVEFPAQMSSNTENISIWWRHHAWFHHQKCPLLFQQVFIIIHVKFNAMK